MGGFEPATAPGYEDAGVRTVTIDGDRATGESYTIAHHLYTEDGDRKIMIASLRSLDTFAKINGRWYFADRNLILDWSETRAMTTTALGRRPTPRGSAN